MHQFKRRSTPPQVSKSDEIGKKAKAREAELTQQLTKAEATAKRAQQLENDLAQQASMGGCPQ
jgi:hypothetical protein